MAKTKTKNIHVPLVITGYILFALLTIAVLTSITIPFAITFSHLNSLKTNTAIILLAMTIGALLPATLAYIAGNNSVKLKSGTIHHFNGVLFGLLAYWIVILLQIFLSVSPQQISDNNVRILVVHLLPSIGVGIVTAILAIMHLRSNQASRDVISYKPYGIVLISCVVATPLIAFAQAIATNDINSDSFLSVGSLLLFGLASYASLWNYHTSVFTRLVWSAVSVSVLFVITYIASMLVSSVSNYGIHSSVQESQFFYVIVSWAAACIGWVIYWVVQLRCLSGIRAR